MPTQEHYLETYRNPYDEPRRARGGPRIGGKSLFRRRAEGLVPRGKFGEVGLQSPAVGLGIVDLERRAVPLNAYPQYGKLTVLERIFFKELLRRRLKPEVDFTAQENIEGGKATLGGLAPDFTIFFPIKRAVDVQGEVFHSGIVPAMRDEVKAMYLKGIGFVDVLYIHEYELRSDDLTQAWFRRELGL